MKSIALVITLALACSPALADDPAASVTAKDKLVVETVLRLKDFDLNSSAPAKAAVLRFLRAQPGSDQYFELIKRFELMEMAAELTDYSLAHAHQTSGVRGAELLFELGGEAALVKELSSSDESRAAAAVTLIGHAGGKMTTKLLLPSLEDPQTPLAIRSAAVLAVGRQLDGQQAILSLVTQGKLADELKFAAANVLLSSADEAIAKEAAKHLELPATADSQPLPPLTELVKRRGKVEHGELVFKTVGTCSNCHKVKGIGKEVGPDLSEIGSKLSREAMYVSILDPSAAVSHNFETYLLLTDEGIAVKGLLVSETDEAVTLRTIEGLDRTVEKEAIEVFKKQKQSLMPQDLQKLLTIDQLVDVVEYTVSLVKNEN